MVALCTKKLSTYITKGLIRLDCSSVENLPYKTGQFTKICSVNTLYFWKDSVVAIKELKRVLENDGVLVITFGDQKSMVKGVVTKYDFNLFSEQDVQNILVSEGFIINKVTKSIDNSGEFFSISAINKA